MKIIVTSFLLGAVIAGSGVFYYTEKDRQTAIKIEMQAELANAIGRADIAYQTKPPAVAKWELEHLRDLLQSGRISLYEDADRIAFYRFLANGRLAVICRDLGEATAYEQYAAAALRLAKPSYGTITNIGSLFSVLTNRDVQARRGARLKSEDESSTDLR
jgi:hypothetical protein